MKRRRKKKDVDHVTPQTSCSTSLLVSLGYELSKVRTCDDKMEDSYIVKFEGDVIAQIKRKNFFRFASKRHPLLRPAPLQRKIAYCID